jgi:hypothetical protein
VILKDSGFLQEREDIAERAPGTTSSGSRETGFHAENPLEAHSARAALMFEAVVDVPTPPLP